MTETQPGSPDDPRPEFSRMVKLQALGAAPMVLTAEPDECAALARRFGISALEKLSATVDLERRGQAVIADGSLVAEVVQACAISGEDFRHRMEAPLSLRFVPAGPKPDEENAEIELESGDLDEIEFSGDSFDLGEAVAQSLALEIDPYAEGPDADAIRRKAGLESDETPRGPLADALAALKRD